MKNIIEIIKKTAQILIISVFIVLCTFLDNYSIAIACDTLLFRQEYNLLNYLFTECETRAVKFPIDHFKNIKGEETRVITFYDKENERTIDLYLFDTLAGFSPNDILYIVDNYPFQIAKDGQKSLVWGYKIKQDDLIIFGFASHSGQGFDQLMTLNEGEIPTYTIFLESYGFSD